MKKYAMTCSCGQTMTVEGMNRDEAALKLKAMMDQKGVDDHWMKFHADDKNPKLTVMQAHAGIDQSLSEVAAM